MPVISHLVVSVFCGSTFEHNGDISGSGTPSTWEHIIVSTAREWLASLALKVSLD